MRLGATIHRYCGLRIDNPDAYISECQKHGFRAATCPDHLIGDTGQIQEIRNAFDAADIVIAEIGGWANCIDPRPDQRRKAIATMAEALTVADEIGAVCCINVAGSFNTEKMYDVHPDNFGDDAFDAVVEWIGSVLHQVNPSRAKLAIESSPWTPIDCPEAYQRLLNAVNHPGLGVHFDPVNFVTDNRTYLNTTQLLHHFFDLFGTKIVACHAKDIRQGDPKTVCLQEVRPGLGVIDYRAFLKRAEQLSPDLPVIIEHLSTEEDYIQAAQYIRSVSTEN